MKMWGGRFEKEPDARFLEFSSSTGFDARLYPYDLEVTRAWVGALERSGVLSGRESESIGVALGQIEKELDSGSFEFSAQDEDIHTAIERRLVELVGPAGGRIRTGRSRNDQVATDLRLNVMDECESLVTGVKELQKSLIERARETIDVPVPGHTHLQQAQPVLLAHILLAFVHMLQRDVSRFKGARNSADCMPLGSGALAGTTLGLDLDEIAGKLGFSSHAENSIDSVSDRDFAIDLAYALAMTMLHLSRLSEQVILWCSSEFGLVDLDDAWATGSSLMPQKKNPDGPELVRGKSGRAIGCLVAIMNVVKGLPLAYNRDLQEDKELLFDSVDTVTRSLEVMGGTVATMKFNRSRAEQLLGSGFITATDLAEFLVERGMDFPEAHRLTGKIVSECLDSGKTVNDLRADDLSRFSDLLDDAALEWISVDASLKRRNLPSGTSPEQVSKQLDRASKMVTGG